MEPMESVARCLVCGQWGAYNGMLPIDIVFTIPKNDIRKVHRLCPTPTTPQ